MERNRLGPAMMVRDRALTRQCNLLRSLDFSSLHIIGLLLRSFSRRNTVAEAVEQAVVGTAEVVAPAAAQEAVPEVELVAAQVAEPAVGQAEVKAGVPAAPVAAPAAEKAAPGAARREASAGTAIRLTIRRGRLFRSFPRLRPPISK